MRSLTLVPVPYRFAFAFIVASLLPPVCALIWLVVARHHRLLRWFGCTFCYALPPLLLPPRSVRLVLVYCRALLVRSFGSPRYYYGYYASRGSHPQRVTFTLPLRAHTSSIYHTWRTRTVRSRAAFFLRWVCLFTFVACRCPFLTLLRLRVLFRLVYLPRCAFCTCRVALRFILPPGVQFVLPPVPGLLRYLPAAVHRLFYVYWFPTLRLRSLPTTRTTTAFCLHLRCGCICAGV